MKIVETKKKYGVEFKIVGGMDELNEVYRWTRQNAIRHLYTNARQQNRYVAYYYIRNEALIMAFKLRWI